MTQRERVDIHLLRRELGSSTATALSARVTQLESDVAVLQSQVATLQSNDVVGITDADSPYVPGTNEVLVLVDASSGDVTVSFPTAADWEGRRISVKRTDDTSGGYTVTVDGSGSEELDTGLTATIGFQWESVSFMSDGTDWWIE